MNENSFTQTEESSRTANNEYELVYEEEEEGEYEADNLLHFDNSYKDPRDKIIIENQKKIQRMQREFKKTVAEMRAQLAEICEQSSKLQFEMLDRIIQLKEKIKATNERNDFLRRGLPVQKKKTLKKKRTKKRSKPKKVIQTTQTQEIISSESF